MNDSFWKRRRKQRKRRDVKWQHQLSRYEPLSREEEDKIRSSWGTGAHSAAGSSKLASLLPEQASLTQPRRVISRRELLNTLINCKKLS